MTRYIRAEYDIFGAGTIDEHIAYWEAHLACLEEMRENAHVVFEVVEDEVQFSTTDPETARQFGMVGEESHKLGVTFYGPEEDFWKAKFVL